MAESGYNVGFGKPPQDTQFKKGFSGNPRGRPKGSLNMATTFNKVMNQKISITEGGKKRIVTAAEGILLQLRNKALSGDPRSIREFLKWQQILENTGLDACYPTEGDERQKKLVQKFLKRQAEMFHERVEDLPESFEVKPLNVID